MNRSTIEKAYCVLDQLVKFIRFVNVFLTFKYRLHV